MSQENRPESKELRKFLKKHPDTRFMELLAPDMVGVLRGKRVGEYDF